MKIHKKLILLSALPLLFLMIAACGPYGAPAFDAEQAHGIVAGTTTFSVAKKTMPFTKARESSVVDPNLTFGTVKVYVETLEFPDMGMTLISTSKGKDPVVDKIELGQEFNGWGPGFVSIGYSGMQYVEDTMGEPQFKNEHSLFYEGIEFQFGKVKDADEPVLKKVIIG